MIRQMIDLQKSGWKKKARHELQKFSHYSLVGVATNLGGYVIFLVLIWQGIDPIIASTVCYFVGVTASYVLNRRLTFRSKRSHAGAIPRFVGAYGVGLVVTVLSMAQLVPLLGPMLAQIATVVIAAVSIYVTLVLIKF